MAKKTAYSAGESSRRITRKLTFANLAVMTVLLALSLVALNVVTTVATYHRIDSEQVRQLIGFAKSHFSAEEHSERLPAGLHPAAVSSRHFRVSQQTTVWSGGNPGSLLSTP